ncbi:Tyrosine-protein phosphatase corkscrew -like protein [Echinococcus granulosus]|nr:Tyrosine-protein phosphatase corkscrew -like protein [Echinococcus granulosus]
MFPLLGRRIKKGALTTFTSAAHIVTVILMEKSVEVDFTCRVFAVLPHDQKDPRTVTQLHLRLWNDYGVSPEEKLYLILQAHLALLAKYPLSEFGPPVVHCSAGVGRTGTFICSRFLLDQLLKDSSNIDIIGTTLAVRRWHKNLVLVDLSFKTKLI